MIEMIVFAVAAAEQHREIAETHRTKKQEEAGHDDDDEITVTTNPKEHEEKEGLKNVSSLSPAHSGLRPLDDRPLTY